MLFEFDNLNACKLHDNYSPNKIKTTATDYSFKRKKWCILFTEVTAIAMWMATTTTVVELLVLLEMVATI